VRFITKCMIEIQKMLIDFRGKKVVILYKFKALHYLKLCDYKKLMVVDFFVRNNKLL